MSTYLPPRYLFRRSELLRQLRPGNRFLELGAADLTLSRELLAHFMSGVAVELTPDAEEALKSLPAELRDRLDVLVADAMEDVVEGQFDAVVFCEVLEHIEDDAAWLAMIHQRLLPGGQLVASVPSRMKYWTHHDEMVGHLRRYERDDLTRLITSAGFGNVRVTSYGFPWVNLLRLPRLLLARRQGAAVSHLGQVDRTMESNHRQIPDGLRDSPLRFVTRPALFEPFAWLSRPFNRLDLSDGYLVTADRL